MALDEVDLLSQYGHLPVFENYKNLGHVNPRYSG
jgi:hypothetical protein